MPPGMCVEGGMNYFRRIGLIGLILAGMLMGGTARGQTALGKNPLDKFVTTLWGTTNTNANAVIWGLNNSGTLAFTNAALFTNITQKLFAPGSNVTFATNAAGVVTINSAGGGGGGGTNYYFNTSQFSANASQLISLISGVTLTNLNVSNSMVVAGGVTFNGNLTSLINVLSADGSGMLGGVSWDTDGDLIANSYLVNSGPTVIDVDGNFVGPGTNRLVASRNGITTNLTAKGANGFTNFIVGDNGITHVPATSEIDIDDGGGLVVNSNSAITLFSTNSLIAINESNSMGIVNRGNLEKWLFWGVNKPSNNVARLFEVSNATNNLVNTNRNIATTSPLLGGGHLNADLVLSIQTASGSQAGALSAADWTTFNGKISGNQTIALSGDVTGSGTTAITTVGQIQNIGGAPERGWLTSTPAANTVLGYSANGAYLGLYRATGTGLSNYQANFIFNGSQQWGTATNMTFGFVNHVIYVNGHPAYQSTNGTLGEEDGLTLKNLDPKQAIYLAFSSPASGNGPLGTPGGVVMSNPADFQIGMGGWVYGTNTLSGLGIGNDILFTSNPGHDWFWTTTENSGAKGAREFLSYDQANAIFRVPVDVSGNGTFRNTGYQTLIGIDEKNSTFTNNGTSYLNGAVNVSAGINFSGANQFLNFGGVNLLLSGADLVISNGSNLKILTGSLNLPGASSQAIFRGVGTPGAPSFLFANNDFINIDSSGNLALGIYQTGTVSDYAVVITNTHSTVYMKTNLDVAGTIAGNGAGLTNINTNAFDMASLLAVTNKVGTNDQRSLTLGGSVSMASGVFTNGFTNQAATASTLAVYDANKKAGSLANGGANTFLQGTSPPTYTGVNSNAFDAGTLAWISALGNVSTVVTTNLTLNTPWTNNYGVNVLLVGMSALCAEASIAGTSGGVIRSTGANGKTNAFGGPTLVGMAAATITNGVPAVVVEPLGVVTVADTSTGIGNSVTSLSGAQIWYSVPLASAALLAANNTFTGNNTFSGGYNSFAGSGAGLTNSQGLGYVSTLTNFITTVYGAGTSATNLFTNTTTFPAGLLAVNGNTIHISAYGTNADGNSKAILMYFGTTPILAVNGALSSGKAWWANYDITRTGAATEIISGTIFSGPSSTGGAFTNFAGAENLANALPFGISCVPGATGDIGLTQFKITLVP